MLENFREEPIRSQAIKDAARGAPCSARFNGICNFNPETTVWCHMNGARYGKGTGSKAHDVCGFDGCSSCHEYFDRGHATHPVLSPEEFHLAVLGAVLESYVRRIRLGIVVVPQDEPKPVSKRPVAKHKPRGERKAINSNPTIPQRANAWPPRGSRKVAQRRKEPSNA